VEQRNLNVIFNVISTFENDSSLGFTSYGGFAAILMSIHWHRLTLLAGGGITWDVSDM
jgi:hypothetical protein